MIRRVAMLSVHTGPLDVLGGKETGGMNVYVRELTRAFGKLGVATDVFTRSQDVRTPRVRPLGLSGRVVAVPAGPEQPYNKNDVYYNLPEFVRGVLSFAEADGAAYDVIHGHYWLSGLAAHGLSNQWHVPIVQMFHTLGELKNRVAGSPAEMEPPLRIAKEREIIGFADRIIAATSLECDEMVSWYGADPGKISIVPPGVDLNLFRAIPTAEARRCIGVPENHQMILFVGRIQPIKGIDTLIRALAVLLQKQPSLRERVCVCIIGGVPDCDSDDASEMARLKALREELGIGDMVTFLGSKDQDTLVYYYSAAGVVVVPSHYESFGMVALEAMACGTPIIASNVGGLSVSISDSFNGYLVPERDPEALAEKIQLVLNQEGLRQMLSEQASQWVERYSWSNIAREMLDVYRQAIVNARNEVPSPCR